MSKIRVVVADDQTLFKELLARCIQGENDMQLAHAASSADAVLEYVSKHPVDVILMDVQMPGAYSFDVAEKIRDTHPNVKILFISMYEDEEYLAESMRVGGKGYLLKTSDTGALLDAVRQVHVGGSYMTPKMMNLLVTRYREFSNGLRTVKDASLTERERQIIKQLAEGKTCKEVAASLKVSPKTVEAHKYNLMKKLDLHNKVEIVQYALKNRLVRFGDDPARVSAPR